MLTDFRHPPMLFRLRLCLPWATSAVDSNIFMPTVQWDEVGFINWERLRCRFADLTDKPSPDPVKREETYQSTLNMKLYFCSHSEA